jgi:hypothetical protein
MLEMKNSINQMKNIVKSIINRLDQVEERLSGIEGKVKEILQYFYAAIKKRKHNHNLQELWNMIKRTNLRISGGRRMR